jgi:hypothetical protein
MLRWARKSNARGSLLALYALVAVSLVFAQRCLKPDQPVNHINLAAYALPGGELPTLCSGKAHSENGTRDQSCKVCEICAPSTTPVLAHQYVSASVPNLGEAVALSIPDDVHGTANVPTNVRSRAPPSGVSRTS